MAAPHCGASEVVDLERPPTNAHHQGVHIQEQQMMMGTQHGVCGIKILLLALAACCALGLVQGQGMGAGLAVLCCMLDCARIQERGPTGRGLAVAWQGRGVEGLRR